MSSRVDKNARGGQCPSMTETNAAPVINVNLRPCACGHQAKAHEYEPGLFSRCFHGSGPNEDASGYRRGCSCSAYRAVGDQMRAILIRAEVDAWNTWFAYRDAAIHACGLSRSDRAFHWRKAREYRRRALRVSIRINTRSAP